MISTKKVYTFRSSSSPEKVYTTLLLSDGSTTCNCPGWTRRVGINNERMCVHTRLVKAGNAEADPLYVSDVWPSYPTQDYKTEYMSWKRLMNVPKAIIASYESLSRCADCNAWHTAHFIFCRKNAIPKPPRQEPQPKPGNGLPRRKFSFEFLINFMKAKALLHFTLD